MCESTQPAKWGQGHDLIMSYSHFTPKNSFGLLRVVAVKLSHRLQIQYTVERAARQSTQIAFQSGSSRVNPCMAEPPDKVKKDEHTVCETEEPKWLSVQFALPGGRAGTQSKGFHVQAMNAAM